MQHVRLLLLLLVSPWHTESFLPSARPRRVLDRSVEPGRQTKMMCGISAGDATATTSSAVSVVGSNARTSTWSNPGGQDLVQVFDDVWAAERPFIWNSIDVGGRMAVVKLSNGSLWVHSPVELDGPLREALSKLGPVAHIVSPNYEHVKYARQWVEAYPDAKSYACPGLAERHPEVGFTREIGASLEDENVPEWGGEIQACFMDTEKNPFTGKPFFNEVVFFHRPTKSLITADLYWNYPKEGLPFGTKAWKFGMDKVYLPFFKKLMVTDKAALASKINKLVGWGVEAIIPCHGHIVRSGAAEALREAVLGTGGASG